MLCTTKKQIDDIAHPPRTAPVHWIEKETGILSVFARIRSTGDAATKRNAYVRAYRDMYNLPELVRAKLSDQAIQRTSQREYKRQALWGL
jgi:hypothetical protein